MAPGSRSTAATVVTALVFSAIETLAVAPPPLLVMAGGSLALVMVTAIAWLSVLVPSETSTTTS